MASTQVIRVTMFKFPKKEHQEAMVENYREMMKTAVKDGKPYILSIEAGPASDDSNPNFNFVGKSVFESLADMKYYENECVAHKTLKAKAVRELELEGVPMTVYYTPTFSSSL